VAMAAFVSMVVMLRIVNMLVLVHLSVMFMRMDMLISGVATHGLSPPD